MKEVQEVMNELARYGNSSYKKVYLNQGAREPLFGVKIGDLKRIVKRYKNNHSLGLALYRTGNSDAMYLAGLMVDPRRMTPELLEEWVNAANWYILSEYAVAGVAAESPYGKDMARKWINSDQEMIANAGWATWAHLVAFLPNNELDEKEIDQLLETVRTTIHKKANRVRYSMNNFIIAVGGLYSPLSEKAMQIAKEVGDVIVKLEGNAFKAPNAPDQIKKIKDAGEPGTEKGFE